MEPLIVVLELATALEVLETGPALEVESTGVVELETETVDEVLV